jgi:hypothetical protein
MTGRDEGISGKGSNANGVVAEMMSVQAGRATTALRLRMIGNDTPG